MESEENPTGCTPPEIREIAQASICNLLPQKSMQRYEKQKEVFLHWCKQRNIQNYSENVLMAYFNEKATTLKSSTLWSVYSMLKTTLRLNFNVDISKYFKLITFLKRHSEGYKPKKSNTFSREEVNKFLEAPDDKYLLMKVVLVIGIGGACRCDELLKMTINDVIDKGDMLLIHIPYSKNKTQRSFVITQEESFANINLVELYRKYINLRPKNIPHERLFAYYRSGKCTVQPVGINTISKIPCNIATYLKLPNPTNYTGHCLRRTSASLLVNEGGNLLQLKQHGGWKSSTVAEGYINQSIIAKQATANLILHGQHGSNVHNDSSTPSTSSTITSACTTNLNKPYNIIMENCSNCSINVNINNSDSTKS